MGRLGLNRQLYRKIFLIRTAEETIREIYPTDVMKTPVHLSHGQEAIAAGVCQALRSADQVFGTYRGHALYLAKGGDLDHFFGELYGNVSGIARGKAGSMHISCPAAGFLASSAIVGSILPVALGGAFSAKYRDQDQIAAVFFGDGATEEGVFWETLNSAAKLQLPLLMVCEDNGLAIHAHKQDRQAYDLAEAVKAFGIPIVAEEGTDPEKIYTLSVEAVKTVKNSGGPYFMHLHYHRYLEHVGIHDDYNAGYRQKENFQHWREVDPLALERQKLLDIGMTDTEISELEKAVSREIKDSIRRVEAADLPPQN